MNDLPEGIMEFLSIKSVKENLSRKELIEEIVRNKEACVAECGSLASWTTAESTGRLPNLTFMVRDEISEKEIDWSSKACLPLDKDVFNEALSEAFENLKSSENIYLSERSLGADKKYNLPIKMYSNKALSILFADNMFRERYTKKSEIFDREFQLIVLPDYYIQSEKYKDFLKKQKKDNQGILIAMDFTRNIGLVCGSKYLGTIKKLMFTVMNYHLPDSEILPLHCSANIGKDGDVALFLGLSGTGKTTLSSEPDRNLIGDDEHGWSADGVANFENGCYAKLHNLNPDKEPEIYRALFKKRDYLESGTLIENALMFPNGTFNLTDTRLTENSRGSYRLVYLKQVSTELVHDHPGYIIFLTADANGVLPPVAKLDVKQAMLWFMLGYTSKLAGTEAGITEPKTTFSRFFGEPFMPRKPKVYMNLLQAKMQQYNSKVYLVNTGWSGGAYGEGTRMDINLTRAIVKGILSGNLDKVNYEENKLFHLLIPESCPGVDSLLLKPENTWRDKDAYFKRAKKLASEFSEYFDKIYLTGGIDGDLKDICPGK